MAVAVGPALRIEPHVSASVPSTFTALAEMFAPSAADRVVAVVTATALLGAEPAMGWVQLHDATQGIIAQVRIYGTQTIVLVLPDVADGNLLTVSAAPYTYGTEEWVGSRVWVERAEVTLLDGFTDITSSPSTYAPPLPPPQFEATDATNSTVLTYALGNSWGSPVLSTAWRWRPLGSEDWLTIVADTSGSVTLPFDLIDSGVTWEVQGQETSLGGPSAWGPTGTWDAPGGDPPPPPTGDLGYGISFGENYGL